MYTSASSTTVLSLRRHNHIFAYSCEQHTNFRTVSSYRPMVADFRIYPMFMVAYMLRYKARHEVELTGCGHYASISRPLYACQLLPLLLLQFLLCISGRYLELFRGNRVFRWFPANFLAKIVRSL